MKNVKYITLLIAITMVTLACSLFSVNQGSTSRVEGSGVLASEERPVSSFTAVEIDGSAIVTISFGDTVSVVVETDDNILPLIETTVRGRALVIETKPNTNIDTKLGIHVTITMKSLEGATIRGSGNINIADVQADKLDFRIPGSGVITATGNAERLDARIDGSGNIVCDELQAKSASVEINGSGKVIVYASESLDASINGSGNVVYSGNPASVESSIQGSGSVNPAP